MTKNNIEKKMEAVQISDPMTHIDLEIMNRLKQLYEDAKKSGYTGTMEEYQKTLSLEDLKTIDLASGGTVSDQLKQLKSVLQ